jgi:hypothetical protein
MRLHHQNPEDRERPASEAGEGAANDAALREQGAALLAAADAAISRALSGNSTAFLAQNRQSGGQ